MTARGSAPAGPGRFITALGLAACLASAAAARIDPDKAPIRFDDFEDQNLDGWTVSQQAPDQIAVAAGGALEGNYGVLITIDGPAGRGQAFLEDPTPEREDFYIASLLARVSDLTPGTNDQPALFVARDDVSGQPVVRVRLKKFGPEDYRLRAEAAEAAPGTYRQTDWHAVADPRLTTLGFAWQAADESREGLLHFLVDGRVVQSLYGLSNNGQRIDAARIGAALGVPGTRGTLAVDGFGSARRGPMDEVWGRPVLRRFSWVAVPHVIAAQSDQPMQLDLFELASHVSSGQFVEVARSISDDALASDGTVRQVAVAGRLISPTQQEWPVRATLLTTASDNRSVSSMPELVRFDSVDAAVRSLLEPDRSANASALFPFLPCDTRATDCAECLAEDATCKSSAIRESLQNVFFCTFAAPGDQFDLCELLQCPLNPVNPTETLRCIVDCAISDASQRETCFGIAANELFNILGQCEVCLRACNARFTPACGTPLKVGYRIRNLCPGEAVELTLCVEDRGAQTVTATAASNVGAFAAFVAQGQTFNVWVTDVYYEDELEFLGPAVCNLRNGDRCRTVDRRSFLGTYENLERTAPNLESGQEYVIVDAGGPCCPSGSARTFKVTGRVESDLEGRRPIRVTLEATGPNGVPFAPETKTARVNGVPIIAFQTRLPDQSTYVVTAESDTLTCGEPYAGQIRGANGTFSLQCNCDEPNTECEEVEIPRRREIANERFDSGCTSCTVEDICIRWRDEQQCDSTGFDKTMFGEDYSVYEQEGYLGPYLQATLEAPAVVSGVALADDHAIVSAAAIHEDGIIAFQVFVDGELIYTEDLPGGPVYAVLGDYVVDTLALPNGEHDVEVGAVSGAIPTTVTFKQFPLDIHHANGGCATDHTGPAVDVAAPESGATVAPGPTLIRVNAVDASGVAQVVYYVDNRSIGTDANPPYSIQWSASPGAHQIKARAFDTCGNSAWSAIHSVNVLGPCDSDHVVETALLTSPAHNSVVAPGCPIEAAVSAGDANGIVQVEFYVDGVMTSFDSLPPFTMSYWGTPAGTHTVRARVVDGCDNSAWTSQVTVTAQAGAPCTCDTVSPTASVAAPPNNTVIPRSGTQIVASASDNLALMAVAFVIDGSVPDDAVLLYEPYEYAFTPTRGVHDIRVRALDHCGNLAESAPIAVQTQNTAPTPVDDAATTRANTPVSINVTANDGDPDGDTPTVGVNAGIPQPPQHGAAVRVDGSTIRYTPAAGFTGSDTFVYRVVDGFGGMMTARVTISVTP